MSTPSSRSSFSPGSDIRFSSSRRSTSEVSRLLEFIRRNFNLAPDAEVTLEANPASTDEMKIAAWLEGGVNRLSLGVQGFDPRALAVLERKTDAAQAVRAFSLAREMGMSNVSIDLIYAVPFQSLRTWLETLRRAIALGPDHVSTYCLAFEEGTLLDRFGPVYGRVFTHGRYDIGQKLDFLRANIELALERPDLGPLLADYLRALVRDRLT